MIEIPKEFFCITTNHAIFPLYFGYMWYCHYLFSYWSFIASLEGSQTDHILLMIHKFSFKHFIKIFYTYLHQRNWPIIFCLLFYKCFVFRVILASYNMFSILTSLFCGIVWRASKLVLP
jgi:hypothetical protein